MFIKKSHPMNYDVADVLRECGTHIPVFLEGRSSRNIYAIELRPPEKFQEFPEEFLNFPNRRINIRCYKIVGPGLEEEGQYWYLNIIHFIIISITFIRLYLLSRLFPSRLSYILEFGRKPPYSVWCYDFEGETLSLAVKSAINKMKEVDEEEVEREKKIQAEDERYAERLKQ